MIKAYFESCKIINLVIKFMKSQKINEEVLKEVGDIMSHFSA